MQFLLSAGEASGDTYGAQLIDALRQLAPGSTFFGMGGEKMRSSGCELLIDAKDVAVVGLVEVVKHLPDIRRRFKHLVAEAARRKPDAAILIDFPDFNLRLARELHRLGIPVFYFVSPQIWAWRTGRVQQIKKYVRKMIVIFPFEQEFYRRHGVEVSYVGHPLAYEPPPQISREEFAAQHGLDPKKQWIALLPGSRRKEVRLNLPAMMEAVGSLQKQGDFEFLLPVASTLSEAWLREQLEAQGLKPQFINASYAALKGRSSTETFSSSTSQPVTEQSNPSGLAATEQPSSLTGWSRPSGLRKELNNTPALAAEVIKESIPIRLTHNARATLMHARAAVVASGTATVEAALSGTPFVVVYRLAPLTWLVGRRLVKLDTFAMPNLIAGKKIVTELIQKDFTAQNVVRELNAIIPDGTARQQMEAALKMVQQRLHDSQDAEPPARRAA
ncbi:MAG TPA: lipid-A-disaccharide synthase, partial [Alphaproteobacteria bacterium]|nr:lipid-A-disaccharide synthase [Alphaproteobacteria bacterium]